MARLLIAVLNLAILLVYVGVAALVAWLVGWGFLAVYGALSLTVATIRVGYLLVVGVRALLSEASGPVYSDEASP